MGYRQSDEHKEGCKHSKRAQSNGLCPQTQPHLLKRPRCGQALPVLRFQVRRLNFPCALQLAVGHTSEGPQSVTHRRCSRAQHWQDG
jgi:hypothetical protein